MSEPSLRDAEATPSPALSPIDATYRYGRLLYSPMRPSQVTAVAAAAVVPLVAGALLVWAIVERPEKQAIGIYLVVLAVAGGFFWLLTSPSYARAYAARRGEFLQSAGLGILRESSERARRAEPDATGAADSVAQVAVLAAVTSPAAVTMPYRESRWKNPLRVLWLLVEAELVLTRSNEFSIFALWPDAESYLTGEESQGLSALVTRARGLRASAMTATAAAAASLAVDGDEGWHRYPLVALSVALFLLAAGSLIRSDWARYQTLHQKAQLISRHSTEIIASYGLRAKGPVDRLAALRQLSLSILVGSSGLPASYRSQNAIADRLVPQVADAVGESIKTSLQAALRRPVVANVKGSMSLSLRQVSPERSQLEVKVATGPDAWQVAALMGDTPFQLSGGEDRPSASLEVTVDAPGLKITPRQQEAQLPTVNASKDWKFMLDGQWESDVMIWVTLFSSGRYVQAVQLDSDELERLDEL
ncbi:MAG TPA: hypothetical protein VHN16_10760 [Streptosporangiaceae bacterium]|nr:hypothetical protein [Streptosporangiaceae bacterium]